MSLADAISSTAVAEDEGAPAKLDAGHDVEAPATAVVVDAVARPEHALHTFDALYCELTGDTPVAPAFADEK